MSTMFEPFMRYWFKPGLGQTVLDVGAHVGKYTLKSSRIVGASGQVIAVEAYPENYSLLVENVRLNECRNVLTVKCAVWNRSTEAALFLGKEVFGSRSGLHSLRSNQGCGQIKVRTKTLDEILEEQEIGRVDWLKIDVEGAELEALEGGRRMISASKPRIVLEVRPFQVVRLKKFADEYGYGIIQIDSSKEKSCPSSGYWFLTPLPEN